MLHGALRKIKDSPPINRIKSKWVQKIETGSNLAQMKKTTSMTLTQSTSKIVQPLTIR